MQRPHGGNVSDKKEDILILYEEKRQKPVDFIKI